MKRDWLLIATLALAAICLVGLLSSETADTDFWWHLKTGQYIVQHHALPIPDPFAYTTALFPAAYPGEDQVRHFNLSHEWLAQALLYIVFSVGGIPAVVLARAIILAIFCGLAGLIAARRSGDPYKGIIAAFATAWMTVNFAVDRPAVVTFLFVAIFIVILELRRGLWLLPPLALLWANSHGGFFMGWVVLLAYCVESLKKDAQRDRKQLWLASAAAIALSLINPNGWTVLETLIRYRGSTLQSSLVEWRPPSLWGHPYAFDILFYVAAAVLLFSWRRVRIVDWILFAAFAAAALTAFRNTVFIGWLAPVMIVGYFPWNFRLPQAISWVTPSLLAAAIMMGAGSGTFFQLHAADWKFPAATADYLATHPPAGKLLNTYEQGGYFIWRLWPQQQVFVDGRALSESAYRDYWQMLYNYGPANETGESNLLAGRRAELLDRYGIQMVSMNTFEYFSGALYPLALALGSEASKEWLLVYDDAQNLIFWRNPPIGTQVFPDKFARVIRHLSTECAAHIDNSPDTPMCARTLGDLWLRSGDREGARRMLTLYLAHAPERDLPAEKALAQLGAR